MSKALVGLPIACLTGTRACRDADLPSEDILREALSSAGYLAEATESESVELDDVDPLQRISSPNKDVITRCNVMLVNLAGLRWDDCELAWELGFAFGKGKPIIGYRPDPQDNSKWEETHGMFFDHIVSSVQELNYVLRLTRTTISEGSTSASSCREQSECDDLLDIDSHTAQDPTSPIAASAIAF